MVPEVVLNPQEPGAGGCVVGVQLGEVVAPRVIPGTHCKLRLSSLRVDHEAEILTVAQTLAVVAVHNRVPRVDRHRGAGGSGDPPGPLGEVTVGGPLREIGVTRIKFLDVGKHHNVVDTGIPDVVGQKVERELVRPPRVDGEAQRIQVAHATGTP